MAEVAGHRLKQSELDVLASSTEVTPTDSQVAGRTHADCNVGHTQSVLLVWRDSLDVAPGRCVTSRLACGDLVCESAVEKLELGSTVELVLGTTPATAGLV